MSSERKQQLASIAWDWIECGYAPKNPGESYPDTVKETREQLAQLAAATDREVVAAAVKFAGWVQQELLALRVAGGLPTGD